jgi:hypothetical protein
MPLLTKSKYTQAVQCKKMLWFSIHQPEKIAIDQNRQFVYDQGTTVGIAAQKLFPSGKLVSPELSFLDKLSTTQSLVNQSMSMFEGAFKWDQCFCIVDALIFYDDGWDLIEVKSATSVKPIHYHDIGFQYFVLDQLGIPIRNACIVHIDTSYIRKGELDYQSLFKCQNVTAEIKELMPSIKKNIHEFLPVFKMKTMDMPIGPQCLTPYQCGAKHACWGEVPDNSIFDLAELPLQDKFSYYYQDRWLIQDFSPSEFSKLKQRQQISCDIEDLDFIHFEKLQLFLLKVQPPVSFLDFEAFQTAIPPFSGLSPYEQIPFQYSLHIDDQSLVHHFYISPPNGDPREALLNSLKERLPEKGSVVVYNKQYESLILRNLKKQLPNASAFIDGLISRLIDLEDPFKKNFIYLREMKGKTSIKYVLPALCPTLSYDHLAITTGKSINAMHQQLSDPHLKGNAYQNLLEYGRLDTYGMVLILQQLRNLSGI